MNVFASLQWLKMDVLALLMVRHVCWWSSP